MKYAVVYVSGTGNTTKVARAIREALPAEDCVAFGAPGEAARQADLIYAGFWTDRGDCCAWMAEFLESLSGKRVALFGTAGFDGSRSYYDTIFARAQKHLPAGNRVVGTYMCPGRMPQSVRDRYDAMLKTDPEDVQAKQMVENWRRAYSHPDQYDLSEARSFARRVLEETSGSCG